MLIQSMTTYTQEQKEWISKLMRTLMPTVSYPPNPSPYQRSLRYKSGVKYVLEDDGKILFNLPATTEFPNAAKLPTILYSRTKIWEEQIWRDLNRHYVINPEHRRYVKAFVSLMRRYRKEYRNHYLLKCIKPQARRQATRCILFDETQLPKEVLNEIVSYM
jgi:hypothetical protein